MKAPFNLVIAGVGGQGVATLARALTQACGLRQLPCHGSLIKGGAQRLGTVLATLRIFPVGTSDHYLHSPEIPSGRLDLLIGLEPWEALRQNRLFKTETLLVIHEKPVSWRVGERETRFLPSPVDMLKHSGLTYQGADFSSSIAGLRLNEAMGWVALPMIPGLAGFSLDEYRLLYHDLSLKQPSTLGNP